MHREYKRRKIIIFSLIGILLLMAVGYSAFQTKLNITSTSNITSVWDVEITNIQTKEINGLAENVYDPTYTKLEANMEANFYEPGDYITYIVTVSNLGTLDATLDSIKLNMPQEDVINFKVEGATSKEKLKVGEHKDIEVTMEYTGNNPDNISSVEMDVNLDYVQDGNSTNFSDADSPVVDNLKINDIILTPDEESVKAEIEAENAIKYYFSIDNNEWYESTSNIYNIYHLKPNTTYTMYVKAEGSNGDVVYSSKPFTTLDNTSPEINIKVGDNVKGENDWYKGLSLNIEVTDNDKVKEVLYCTEKDCTPDKVLNLEDGKTTITFESKRDIQEVCIKATDMKGNVSNKCSSEYKIDGTEPTLSNMTITPKDNVMTVELTAADNESGLYKYYFSKDGGKTYIESDNPNYTFTSLDEGDYLVTAYVKDAAGNESEIQAKSTSIRYTSFCIKNGITDFGDCLIATEAQNPNIDEAKTFIESKGTPDFNKISPSIIYSETKSSSISSFATESVITVSTEYNFHEEAGRYYLKSSSLMSPDEIDLTDGITKYSCGGNSNTCDYLMELSSIETREENGKKIYTVKYYSHNPIVKSYDNSEDGMYSAEDNDGNSYYYRGSVASNYVKFGGAYWRVIRVNGDGTVRMIYDGTSPHANGENSNDRMLDTTKYNSYNTDNAYVGYMFGDTNDGIITESPSEVDTTWAKQLSSTTRYVFGSEYTYDKETNSFKVSGNIIESTISEYQDTYNNPGYYTCFVTNENKSCNKLFHAIRRSNDSSMIVKYVEYSTTSYNQAHENINNSEIKTYIDNMYKDYITSYDDKISDKAYFCNDRSLSNTSANNYNNLGYGQNPTLYKAYDRLGGWGGSESTSAETYNPSLICSEKNDTFTVSDKTGNGKLTYPVGLITADEVNMAGGMPGAINSLYYLYTGATYWTMTPAFFRQLNGNAHVYAVTNTGQLNRWNSTEFSAKIKPVINLDPDKITFTGNGTMQDPYVIS